METMYETENVIVKYDKWNLGGQYKVYTKRDPLRTRVFFNNVSEAVNYAKKLENGGRK